MMLASKTERKTKVITLYGFTLSNYVSMVKMALIEKELEFDWVDVKPSQENDFLTKSPMGKIPCIETEQGFLSETNIILEYIEETGSGINLMPTNSFERARVRELMKEIELYIELPARTLYSEAFFGGTVSDEVKTTAKKNLQKGIACLKRNGKFAPYVAGSEFTYADILLQYSLGLASLSAKRVLEMDLLADLPEAKQLMATISQRPSAIQIAAEHKG
jgi:glutathione S-transferase